jgi:hypothetical protein
MFGSGREEDRMTGYLSFLKIGPQLLKFIPGESQSRVGCVQAYAEPEGQRRLAFGSCFFLVVSE